MKEVIFDLDGTLVNTITDLGYACNYALHSAGYPTHPIDSYPAMVGNGINKLIFRALPEPDRTEDNVLRLRELFVPYYNEHNCDYSRPYEGMEQVLTTLKAQGYRLAVASNKYQQATEKIVNHYFSGLFDVVLGERTNIPRKPDPQIVFDILASLNDKTANESYLEHRPLVHYFGDSLVDRDTAYNAGVPFIACAWGFVPYDQLLSAGIPDIISSPREILDCLKG